MFRLGIDIGGTKVNFGLLDQNNKISAKQKILLPEDKTYPSLLNWLTRQLEQFLEQNNTAKDKIISCGIGLPGTVSEDGKRALKIPNLSWENENLAEDFEKLTGLRAKLVQDSRAAALGEYMAGGAQGKKCAVCITLGTGIGIGIVIDGQIYNGALGCAGESGHIPVVPDGRQCVCGKKGCLNMYAAGMGLNIAAQEAFGGSSTAHDIFNKAKTGNKQALEIIDKTVNLLGNCMISIINLLSPDCLLFSGGIALQTDLLVNPLIIYIKDHGYSLSVENLHIGLAQLGEDAPMVGAALLPQEPICKSHTLSLDKPKLSASIMCADILHLADELKELEKAQIDYIHCDIMDGHFVPNLMLPMDMINSIRQGTNIPFDIHIMAQNPEYIIDRLKLQKGDIVSIHFESTPHVQRALSLIKEKEAAPALALNPSTPIECAREVLNGIEMLLIMTVNPGFAGQKIVPQSFDKVARARKYLNSLGYNNISIQVDGNCSFENIPKLYKAGADNFVVGTSGLFHPRYSIQSAAEELRNLFDEIQ